MLLWSVFVIRHKAVVDEAPSPAVGQKTADKNDHEGINTPPMS